MSMTAADRRHVEAPGATLGPPRLRSRPGADEQALEPLFERWQRHGDRHARQVLVERFMPLARRLARRYLSAREPIEDLMQVASLGLLKAIDRFDTTRGNRFAAFAVPTILGELRRHFRTVSWAVHVPRGAQERALEVDKASDALRAASGRVPTVREISEYLEIDEGEVLDALQTTQAQDALSLDAPFSGDEDQSPDPRSETIGGDDAGYAFVEDSSAVAQALARLSPRERYIVRLRFVAEMTQSEIAARVGLSQMQISRLLRRSLQEMRELAEGPELARREPPREPHAGLRL
jgi:RNA polymerase sigma-B factor